MSKHKIAIKILNPTGGGVPYTSHRRACYYVGAGYARWEGKAIRFTDAFSAASEYRHAQAHIRKYHLLTMDQAGYDHDAANVQSTLDQIQGLPVAGPAEKMVQKGSKWFVPRAPRCKTTVVYDPPPA